MRHPFLAISMLAMCVCCEAHAGVGDPQVATDHPWYPGELSCSTFERLSATQAAMFEQVTGHPFAGAHDRALASWMWRNLHYAHGEEGHEDLWDEGFQGGDTTTREYWTGLFAHGFGLCGTTHAQWTAELNTFLGHGHSRVVGVVGHNSCEVFLFGGPYGSGQWALLDHDISTVVFDPTGSRLLSIDELTRDLDRLTDPMFEQERQQGWPLGGLHPDDPSAYAEFNTVEHLPGYAGPPPMVSLRRGESLRRYFHPGLDDGQTFVFWGRNYNTEGIPGPERSRTWVNQPERFFNSPDGSGYVPGQARFGNAVYTYRPNFADGSYREGVVSETVHEVIFEFQTPYIIAATPPDDSDWGIYEPGGRNGLVVTGSGDAPVAVSVDRGVTWNECGTLSNSLDLTDWVKGHRQYWLRLSESAEQLVDAELEIVTVCQANPATFPRLKEDGSMVTFAATGQAIVSAGPNVDQARAHVISGGFDTPTVTMEIISPRGEAATHIYAAAHVASGNPPDPTVLYLIEYSIDNGQTWEPIGRNRHFIRLRDEPVDFWSQSFWYGDTSLPAELTQPVQVRFRNNGGKRYLRAEVHLAYEVTQQDDCRVTFAWTESDTGPRTEEHVFDADQPQPWTIDTGRQIEVQWVELAPAP